MPNKQRKHINIRTPKKKLYKTNAAMCYNKICRDEFNPDPASKQSAKLVRHIPIAVYTVLGS